MKIAFFTDSYLPQINGVVSSIKLYREELQKLGHTVYVFAPRYPDQKGDDPEIIRYPSLKLVLYPEYRIANPLSVKNSRAIRDLEIDIIHSHSPFGMGLAAETYANIRKVPHIYTHHTLWSEYVHYVPGGQLPGLKSFNVKVTEKLAALFCNRTDRVIAPSEKVEKLLLRYGTKKPITILPTGIRLGEFEGGNPKEFRKRYGIAEDDQLILFMGRLGKEKDVDFVIKAYAKLRKLRPALKLMIVGDGPYADELKESVSGLGIDDGVVFTGYIKGSDRTSAYKSADIFCFSSKSETQGLVLLEADACGVPLAITQDLAYTDVAHDGENAVVTPHQEAAYVRAIDELLDDPKRLKEFSLHSKELATHFTAEGQAKKMVALYQQAIQDYQARE